MRTLSVARDGRGSSEGLEVVPALQKKHFAMNSSPTPALSTVLVLFLSASSLFFSALARTTNVTRSRVLRSDQSNTVIVDLAYSEQHLAAASLGPIYLWDTVTWELDDVVSMGNHQAIQQALYRPDGGQVLTARMANPLSKHRSRKLRSAHGSRRIFARTEVDNLNESYTLSSRSCSLRSSSAADHFWY